MAENRIDYEALVERALRGVMGHALDHAAKNGIPGDHHFYITFRTDYPGAIVPDRLKASYPQEMTIVLQHQFWGLEVTEDAFEVGLSFNRVSERMRVPFAAIRGFYDPSVKFGLEFQVEQSGTVPGEAPAALPAKAEEKAAPDDGKPAEIVSLDSFRKKS